LLHLVLLRLICRSKVAKTIVSVALRSLDETAEALVHRRSLKLRSLEPSVLLLGWMRKHTDLASLIHLHLLEAPLLLGSERGLLHELLLLVLLLLLGHKLVVLRNSKTECRILDARLNERIASSIWVWHALPHSVKS